MTTLKTETKQAKLIELANLITQYDNGERENINGEKYPIWVKIFGMLKTADIDEKDFNDFIANPEKFKVENKIIIKNKNYETEKAAAERNRIDMLTLTPADVERALYKSTGMDFDDLKALISEKLPTIDSKALAIEFRAKDFYRGAEVNGVRLFDTVGQLLGYTSADMDYLFENKVLPEVTNENTTDTGKDNGIQNDVDTANAKTGK